MEPFDITQYLNIAARRQWWIIIPFLLTLLGGLAYVLVTPKIYEAQTLILVQPQKVPEDFVRTIVSASVEDRLKTISQQVTSRTNLERIVKEHSLYSSPENKMLLDDKVALLREMISIEVSHGSRQAETNAFTISYRGKDPKRVAEVTNALASNFIAENLRIRESQAVGTSSFLSDELASVEKRLMEKEEELKQYRERYMGGLPEQLQTNLSILERLQGQLDQLHSNLRGAENRRVVIQTQIAEQQERARVEPSMPGTSEAQEPRNIASLRNTLAALETKYTKNHPDIVRLRKMIAKLEAQKSKGSPDLGETEGAVSEVDQELRRQLKDTVLEIEDNKAEMKRIDSQIKEYQEKVEQTPKREQELLSLQRDYGNLKDLYDSMLSRKLEAEIAVSMEKKQKGEQFRIIDPAKVPARPVAPDLRQIMLITLALGIGLGGGMAFLIETLDTSYKAPEEVEKELQVPVLVSIPIKYTEREYRSVKRRRLLAIASVAVCFILSAIGIVFALKGVDATLDFVKKAFGGV